jgi:hypothetical protein
MTTPNPWQEAVTDELVCLHIYQAKHDTDPRGALKDAINYHVEIALDPQVSSDAQALIDRGHAQAISKLDTLRPLRKMWTIEEIVRLLQEGKR